jgi:hypothetical protein
MLIAVAPGDVNRVVRHRGCPARGAATERGQESLAAKASMASESQAPASESGTTRPRLPSAEAGNSASA